MRPDVHSFFDTEHPRMEHLAWRVRVDFTRHVLHGEATISFSESGTVVLDTRGLNIKSVVVGLGKPILFTLGDEVPILGPPLTFEVPKSHAVKIMYETSPTASALQWLTPAQTAGKKHPFLYSQCEPHHARSMVPCQDTPGVRFTYRTTMAVPRGMRGLMAASIHEMHFALEEVEEFWEMDHPIPAYLLALAVGDLEKVSISPRTRVWAEAGGMAEKAAKEFADVEKMIRAAEALYGSYPWGRFDMLILPAAFPYAGMENPTLVFLTPDVVVGDKSAIHVIVHELAHAWTGNMVTNATWEDFWLNEGWTTYAEMRLMEALFGRELSELNVLRAGQAFERDMERLRKDGRGSLVKLRTELAGIDPDAAFSIVPYHKGYLFLRAIEEAMGRERFDAFVKSYIRAFQFQSVTTLQFLDFLSQELPEAGEKIPIMEWAYDEGLPDRVPQVWCALADKIFAFARSEDLPTAADVATWETTAWSMYLGALCASSCAAKVCQKLDKAFMLSSSPNRSVRCAWYLLAIRSGAAFDRLALASFMGATGRLFYLQQLAQELFTRAPYRQWAHDTLKSFYGRYHPITVSVIEERYAKTSVSE